MGAPVYGPKVTVSEDPNPAERRIPFVAAALLILFCLSAGAATAAFVFHDRMLQITALRPATR